VYELNNFFYHLFYHFARKYTILKGRGATRTAVFNGREDLQYPVITALIQ